MKSPSSSSSSPSSSPPPMFQVYLARGSPYVTSEFNNVQPYIQSSHTVVSYEQVKNNDDKDDVDLDIDFVSCYRIHYKVLNVVPIENNNINDLTWLLFFIPTSSSSSSSEINHGKVELMIDENGSLQTTNKFTGIMRAALIPPSIPQEGINNPVESNPVDNAGNDRNDSDNLRESNQEMSSEEFLLLKHSGIVPISASISWDLNPKPKSNPILATDRAKATATTISSTSTSASAAATTISSTSTTATATGTTISSTSKSQPS
eukprot:CAMPEP_0114369594 /NCGR_PEP_ID=MMETSP0101-20121206/31818_1 /TAXON_ID=38822 ORGANISM="Pteridomonas danica, Strain PT" /NCGR_SAMPLE_ID=MMETSP0101 /ASSEMBLY_ACC=CAM_ASM_000211 /LENGTH=261 /DNA_ID=CAMNT_0001520583 /DNA_START=12 /DNA_END=793 /DNA_ORIENTATION=+